MTYEGLAGRLADVRERIFQCQRASGWHHPVRILAVTKGHGPDAVEAALAVGLVDIAENRVQEALGKQEAIGVTRATWHLIGSLQRNKVRQAVGRFDWIHAVDRTDLVLELAKRVPVGQRQKVLVEVNCSGEAQKGGVPVPAARALVETVMAAPELEFHGLMTMAPFTEDRQVQRAAFRQLRQVKDALEGGGIPVAELSMGMSGDFPAAVEEGATMVRLGTILFGERQP